MKEMADGGQQDGSKEGRKDDVGARTTATGRDGRKQDGAELI